MQIVSIGYNFLHNNNFQIFRPDGLNYYLFLIVRSNAYYFYKNEKKLVSPNSIILFDKKTPQHFGAIDDTYANDWVAFSLNEDEERLFFNLPVPKNEFILSPFTNFFIETIHLMYSEFTFSQNPHSLILKNLFFTLCEKYKEITSDNGLKSPYYNELLNIRNYIYDCPTKKHTIKSLSKKIALSESHFSHLYKKYFLTTPIRDAICSRMEYAKQLLIFTNYSINEIAEFLNYSCDTHFMKQFKIHTNMKASEYRKKFYNK